ncbi:MAG: hypothetical protein ACYDAO_04335 [Thermoplasmataceae archaeon]
MLLKDDGVVIEVHTQKINEQTKYIATVYGIDEAPTAFKINLEQWQDQLDNPLCKYLKKMGKGELWDKLNEDYSDSIGKILFSVSQVIDYGVQSGVDIYFGDDFFRVKKGDYINSQNFQIWYMATKYRIAKLKKGDWEEFLSQCLSGSRKEKHDPLAPDLLDMLVDEIKTGEIHEMLTGGINFCEHIKRYIRNKTGESYFVLDREQKTLYVPKPVISYLRSREKMNPKTLRQFLQPYLKTPKDVLKRAGRYSADDPQAQVRCWEFSIEKLYDYDKSIEAIFSNVLQCNTSSGDDPEA